MENLPQSERTIWVTKLKEIEEEFEEWQRDNGPDNDDEEHHKCQLIEQLGVTKQTKEELTAILKKHEGYSHRIVVSTLKKTA